jgi:hypothetical protein
MKDPHLMLSISLIKAELGTIDLLSTISTNGSVRAISRISKPNTLIH